MKLKLLLFILFFFFLFPKQSFAQNSSYVLPYPSFMPGSTFYRPHLLWEIVSKYFYFGNLSQFKYNLKESDKYLVEAKTLFEYNQFSHASVSLKKSNDFFLSTVNSLSNAQKEGKDISLQKNLLRSATQKHIEVLEKAESSLPETVVWSPEKEKSSVIEIKKEINEAIAVRKKIL